jgi:hypothetical protein
LDKIILKNNDRRQSHALGLVMEKCETIGGVSYDVLKKLIDSLVTPIIEYGGYKSYPYINAVQAGSI